MSPISAGALELGALSPTHKHAKREKTLVILNKLSERDTSKAAVEELYRWIKVIRPYCVGACGVLGSRMHLISERNDNKSTLLVVIREPCNRSGSLGTSLVLQITGSGRSWSDCACELLMCHRDRAEDFGTQGLPLLSHDGLNDTVNITRIASSCQHG